MTRKEALVIAKANFKYLSSANKYFWRSRGQEPAVGDFSYQIHIFGHAFQSEELRDSVEQCRSEDHSLSRL